MGVSELLVTRALSEVLELPRADVARRMMGEWHARRASSGKDLKSAEPSATDPSRALSVLSRLTAGRRRR